MSLILETFFSDKKLIDRICRKRLALARERRKQTFIRGLVGHCGSYADIGDKNLSEQLTRILPPRRTWNSFRPTREARKKLGSTALIRSLSRYVLLQLNTFGPSLEWVSNLRSFLDSIRTTALSWTTANKFTYTRAIAVPKAKSGDHQDYRAIAAFSLRDTLTCACFADYLKTKIDSALSPSSYAFRAAIGGPPRSHHDAVRRLQEYRASFPRHRTIWVAECDIEGFFDSVDHDVARKSVAELASAAGTVLDPRFLAFLESFLEGYDYSTLLKAAKTTLESKGIKNPRFKEMRDILENPAERFGIPQGSQLSCILANTVLAQADRACEGVLQGHSKDGLYLRYCDDVFMAHRSRKSCAEMLQAYLECISASKLAHHPPLKIATYGPEYWDAKSKAPYAWRQGYRAGSCPWVGFVGYQVHRSGKIRVRPKSINKELRKQAKVASDARAALVQESRDARKAGAIHRVPSQTRYRTRLLYHLLSISVGIPQQHDTSPPKGEICWSAGFPLLQEYSCSLEGARRLDRGRRNTVRLIDQYLAKYEKMPQTEEAKTKTKKWSLRFDGPSFSYFVALSPLAPPPAATTG